MERVKKKGVSEKTERRYDVRKDEMCAQEEKRTNKEKHTWKE